MNRPGLVAVLASIALLAAVVAAYELVPRDTKVADIKADPKAYVGRLVTVRGKVLGGASIAGFGGYLLEDETGTLVVRASIIPAQGVTVSARGRVRLPLQATFGKLVLIDTVNDESYQ